MQPRFSSLLATAVVSLTVLGWAACAGASPQLRPLKSADIPVVVQDSDGPQLSAYHALPAVEQALVRHALQRLHRYQTAPRSPFEPADDLAHPTRHGGATASVGCGVIAVKQQLHVGCWQGGTVCYVAIEDGEVVDGGCHACNGTNCPTE